MDPRYVQTCVDTLGMVQWQAAVALGSKEQVGGSSRQLYAPERYEFRLAADIKEYLTEHPADISSAVRES